MPAPKALVTTAWLAERLGDVDIKVVDATFFLPTENRDARAEYLDSHIPGAVFFDIDAIADPTNPLPHMFPDERTFAKAAGELGIGNDSRVICYDRGKTTGACRAWWMFRAFGHDRASVLDGGFRKWRAEGRASENGVPEIAPARFQARYAAAKVCSLEAVRAALEHASAQVLDARSAGRFDGSAAEPRAGLRGGHMPGALNLPYDRLLNDDGTFKSADELRALFAASGLDQQRPVITTCGSGVSAATLLFGLQLIGRSDGALYDGSWSEWGSREDTPVVT